jgi:hypothetical protein
VSIGRTLDADSHGNGEILREDSEGFFGKVFVVRIILKRPVLAEIFHLAIHAGFEGDSCDSLTK